MYVFAFFFLSIYEFFFNYIFYNWSFLMTTLETISGATTACGSKFIQTTFSILSLFFFFLPNKRVFHFFTFFNSNQTQWGKTKISSILPPPHHLGRVLPFLFEYYKKAPCPFSQKQREFTPKTWFKRSFLLWKAS